MTLIVFSTKPDWRKEGRSLKTLKRYQCHVLRYGFYKIAANMQNMAFTPKGDHIPWTHVEQSTSKSVFFFSQMF